MQCKQKMYNTRLFANKQRHKDLLILQNTLLSNYCLFITHFCIIRNRYILFSLHLTSRLYKVVYNLWLKIFHGLIGTFFEVATYSSKLERVKWLLILLLFIYFISQLLDFYLLRFACKEGLTMHTLS